MRRNNQTTRTRLFPATYLADIQGLPMPSVEQPDQVAAQFPKIYAGLLTDFQALQGQYLHLLPRNHLMPKDVFDLPAHGQPIPRYAYARYTNVPTRHCLPFSGEGVSAELVYPAATVPESALGQDAQQAEGQQALNVIAEGPSAENLENLLLGLDMLDVNVLVAVGLPFEGKEKYHNYMAHQTLYPVPQKAAAADADGFTDAAGEDGAPGTYPKQISVADFFKFAVPGAPALEGVDGTNFKFYHLEIIDAGGKKSEKYVMHIPNWADHGFPNFNQADKTVLAYFNQFGPDSCFHCSAGQGRSVALLMAKMLFRHLRKVDKVSMDALRIRLSNILNAIKAVKPTAGEWFQYLIVPGLVDDLLDIAVALNLSASASASASASTDASAGAAPGSAASGGYGGIGPDATGGSGAPAPVPVGDPHASGGDFAKLAAALGEFDVGAALAGMTGGSGGMLADARPSLVDRRTESLRKLDVFIIDLKDGSSQATPDAAAAREQALLLAQLEQVATGLRAEKPDLEAISDVILYLRGFSPVFDLSSADLAASDSAAEEAPTIWEQIDLLLEDLEVGAQSTPAHVPVAPPVTEPPVQRIPDPVRRGSVAPARRAAPPAVPPARVVVPGRGGARGPAVPKMAPVPPLARRPAVGGDALRGLAAPAPGRVAAPAEVADPLGGRTTVAAPGVPPARVPVRGLDMFSGVVPPPALQPGNLAAGGPLAAPTPAGVAVDLGDAVTILDHPYGGDGGLALGGGSLRTGAPAGVGGMSVQNGPGATDPLLGDDEEDVGCGVFCCP